jgi:hypothetical protein
VYKSKVNNMANKDLFKQAIADAKSIREAAIANAKLALEESLTPQLKELLAQRLAEMEEEEAPAAVISEEEVTEEVAEEALEEAIGPDGLQAVAEAEEEGAEEEEEVEGGEEAGEEAEIDSEESEDEAEEEEVGEMSVDDLKDLIRDVLMQVMGDEEAGREDDLEAGAEDMGAEDMTAVDDTEINIDELMAELALINSPEGPTAHGNVAEMEEEADPLAEAAVNELMGYLKAEVKETVGAFAESKGMTMQEVMKEMAKYGASVDMKEVAKMLEATHGLGEAACNRVMERLITGPVATAPAMEENIMADLSIMAAQHPEQVMAAILAAVPALAGAGMGVEKIIQKIRGGATDAAKAGEETPTADELSEALATIETLQNELNETNLLNAKLLYVNKVFKANNLTEGQKANVIAAFDKAETVKEVKLVYETVSDNVTAGGKKEVVKEAKGFASAATGISTKPEVITEANQAVLRMQKLAGIIK